MATSNESVQHFHVWRVAATGRGAFMSRAYLVRSTAKKAASTWAGREHRRALTFVHQCELGGDCPRPPRRPAAVDSGRLRGEGPPAPRGDSGADARNPGMDRAPPG
ncbi:hypothetical protein [Candidatus Palauibacter sp.]|uniref:hypothetical protein n=1 Tax=Candidatus Palauibacter sp. TaxID=3101350 RepID=UPI003B013F31